MPSDTTAATQFRSPFVSDSLLAGKTAVVTGGSRGMGASHVEFLARAGAGVLIGDVLDEQGKQLAERLQGDGLRVEYTHLDVTDPQQWSSAVDLAATLLGPVTVLVNNAGTGGKKSVADCPDDEWNRIIAVNQTGVFYGMRAVIPTMRAQGGGSIVNVASQWSHNGGGPAYVAYVASKWAVRGLTRNAALTLGPDRIRVNSISPGLVDTALLGSPDSVKVQLDRTPLGRIAHVSEISGAVVYLASDLSSYATGADILIEGGLEAG